MAGKILVYEPTLSSNHLCQLGLSSSDKLALVTLIEKFDAMLIEQIKQETHKKRNNKIKRAETVSSTTTSYNFTCETLKQLGKGVVSLTAAQLATLSVSEFEKCEIILGNEQHWSTKQLTTLAALAIKVYKNF